jgi:deoxyribodipyrimidine photo-lyase
MSPYLHFGCVSPITVAGAVGSEEYRRQLCWRDFFHQVLYAFPDLPRRNYRPGAPDDWRDDPPALTAWREGRTGIPIVDAGMRQLAGEGWMHNRARLITASFLTKRLGLDWRDGAHWYAHLLLDADVANNIGNWQWVAGTGNDPRFNRRFNPIRQAQRFDRDGEYVRRWVPELDHVPGAAVHEPWRLPPNERRALRYEGPLAAISNPGRPRLPPASPAGGHPGARHRVLRSLGSRGDPPGALVVVAGAGDRLAPARATGRGVAVLSGHPDLRPADL